MLKSLTIAAVAGLALGECPNACSGHGLCRDRDACSCDPGYVGNDCSQRVCPFDFAFVDAPRGDLDHSGDVDQQKWVKSQWSNAPEFEAFPLGTGGNFNANQGEGHFYAECSGKGECDRQSGECKCYSGYTGSACQRTTCPKDCSGRGTCRTVKEIADGALNKRVTSGFAGHNYFTGVKTGFEYRLWDADKAQACVCDPGYSGIDCSQRQCPRGDDPLTTAPQFCGNQACSWEVQQITLGTHGTYKISFQDYLNNVHYGYVTTTQGNSKGYVADADKKTKLAGPSTTAGLLMKALREIPGGLLQRVEVYAADATANSEVYLVTFVGVPGDVNQLKFTAYDFVPQTAPVIADVTRGNYEAIECSGRGLCDGSSGLCKCFSGYYGASCEFLNALAN